MHVVLLMNCYAMLSQRRQAALALLVPILSAGQLHQSALWAVHIRKKQLGGQTSSFKTLVANAPDPGDVSIMQGQKRYVNGYVVIIFGHYIICCGGGVMRRNVTWASFFGRVGRRLSVANSPHHPWGSQHARPTFLNCSVFAIAIVQPITATAARRTLRSSLAAAHPPESCPG